MSLAPQRGVYDVLIVGGGPAGLSAALLLGRCRRAVLVCDSGTPRNRHSNALHAYLTRDGIVPAEFNALGRDEIARYGVHFKKVEVERITSATDHSSGFTVQLNDGSVEHARYLLIATGVSDEVPPVDGLRDCYGRSVFHCPYCDGWEWRDRHLGALAYGSNGARLALSLKTWSAHVTLFLNGGRLDRIWRSQLERNHVVIEAGRLGRLEHDDGLLRAVILNRNRRAACDALFFAASQSPQSPLATSLGCSFNRKGTVQTGLLCETNIPGVFVAGDASHDAQYVVVAAAEGLKAGLSINQALQQRDLNR